MEVLLEDNMLNKHDRVVFEEDIPYTVVKGKFIVNEDGVAVALDDIWVEYRLIK